MGVQVVVVMFVGVDLSVGRKGNGGGRRERGLGVIRVGVVRVYNSRK
jgi:hypothetical protein